LHSKNPETHYEYLLERQKERAAAWFDLSALNKYRMLAGTR